MKWCTAANGALLCLLVILWYNGELHSELFVMTVMVQTGYVLFLFGVGPFSLIAGDERSVRSSTRGSALILGAINVALSLPSLAQFSIWCIDKLSGS